MLDKIRFHLDESASNAIAEGLRRRGIDVTTTPEQDMIRHSALHFEIQKVTEKTPKIISKNAE